MRKAYAHPPLKFHLGEVGDRTSVVCILLNYTDYIRRTGWKEY